MLTYAVFSGGPTSRAEILRLLTQSLRIQECDDGATVEFNDKRYDIHGLPDDPNAVTQRLWIHTDRSDAHIDALIHSISQALAWRFDVRVGIRRGDTLIPPRIDSLLRLRFARRSGPSRLWHLLCSKAYLLSLVIIFAAFVTLCRNCMPYAKHFTLVFGVLVAARLILSLLMSNPAWRCANFAKSLLYYESWCFMPLVAYALLGGGRVGLIGTGLVLLAFMLGFTWLRMSGRRHDRIARAGAHRAVFSSILPPDIDLDANVCLVCGYDLDKSHSSRCPECGVLNYHMTEKDDSREMALENGALFAESQ